MYDKNCNLTNDNGSSITDIHYHKPHVPYCARCKEPFGLYEKMAQTKPDEHWHLNGKCFVCSHCFRPFNGKDQLEYYEKYGRKYCRKDFITLFAPCCARCQQHITSGRCIRAMNESWHPNCFLCDECKIPLCDMGFVQSNNNHENPYINQQQYEKTRALCHGCNAQLLNKTDASSGESRRRKKHTCFKCKTFIEESHEGPALRFDGETYHVYHFNCNLCGIELNHADSTRQIATGDLYCLRCHDNTLKLVPICGACHRPIEGERYVTALGKRWHVNHFACTQCEKPFHGKRHFEINGLAYCEQDYLRIYGHRCSVCARLIEHNIITALDKYYCLEHFCCRFCSKKLIPNKTKFFDIKSELCCKKCYRKFPADYRKQLAKQKKLEQSISNNSHSSASSSFI